VPRETSVHRRRGRKLPAKLCRPKQDERAARCCCYSDHTQENYPGPYPSSCAPPSHDFFSRFYTPNR